MIFREQKNKKAVKDKIHPITTGWILKQMARLSLG